jgi:hypothetical protein
MGFCFYQPDDAKPPIIFDLSLIFKGHNTYISFNYIILAIE